MTFYPVFATLSVMKNKSIAIVTGGSSGIGKATCLSLIRQGYTVYELSRHEDQNYPFHHLVCDITKEDRVKVCVQEILLKEGHIDLLVNNAGFGIAGAIEFTAIEDAKKQFDVNFFGMATVSHCIIPQMRQQGYGKIINVSSVAGCFPLPFQAYYSASKAAINSYTMALANELRPFRIQVCCVQPGDMATGFTSAREKAYKGDDIYHGRISRNFKGIEKDETTGQSPEMAARMICSLAKKRHVAPIYTIGVTYSLLCFLDRILPHRAVNWLLFILYANHKTK